LPCTGHGYIQSNGQEQIARDVRISSVWEGTTQIQALDLLGRKIMLEKMKPLTEYDYFASPFSDTIATNRFISLCLLLTLFLCFSFSSSFHSFFVQVLSAYFLFLGTVHVSARWHPAC
tara:strand:- start:93 stop:446 length:354 start_codon:yes stop_codon:yes gene_type:complete